MVEKLGQLGQKFINPNKLEEASTLQRKVPEELPNDTFEYDKNYQARLDSEMSGAKFVPKKIKYAQEDVEKMESMSLDEKMDYINNLIATGKITYVDEDPELNQ